MVQIGVAQLLLFKTMVLKCEKNFGISLQKKNINRELPSDLFIFLK